MEMAAPGGFKLGGASLRAVAEGSPRTRASLDLVRAPENRRCARGERAAPR